MRNLTKTVAAISLLAPNGAYPLGIGDIELHSALNQNLKAEIALFVSEDENISDIRVNLAPPAKFEEAGIPRNTFLSKIQFEPVVKPDGTVIVQLSSKEALREPFLDFLLEVSWAKGNLYREFTVLVDPPATYQQETVLVASKSDYAKPVAAPVSPSPSVIEQPVDYHFQTPGEYGPTVKNDTLWEIAEKNITDPNVSVEQMVMAIYEANPHAFYQNNVNALMAGERLRIPDNNTVLKLSRKQARDEFRQQTNEWRDKMTPPAASESAVAEVEAPEAGSQLKLLAPAEAEIQQQDMVTAGETDAEDVTEEKPVEEVADAETGSGQDFQEIQARLDKLEQQLTAMQELLALKDQQLAALQSQKAAPDLQPNADRVEPEVITQPSVSKMADPVEMPRSVEPQQQPVKPVQTNRPKTSEGIDPYYLVVASVGSTLLLVLGWLWWRERKLEEDATESMFASSSEIVLPETDEDLSIPVINDNSSYDVGTVGESSFLSEFIPDDFDALEANQNEVDPISEADVYLAYGRYQQAEELIRQAIEDQPDRNECKLKLLEIYYAEENKNAFEEYAGELAESGKREDAVFWSKVTEMGGDLCPGSQLFSTDESMDGQAANDTDSNSDELDLALSAEELTESELSENEPDLAFDSVTSEANHEEPGSDQFSSLSLDLEPNLSEILVHNESEADSIDNGYLSFSKEEEPDKSADDNQELEASDFDFAALTEIDHEPPESNELEAVDHEIQSLDYDFSDDLTDTKLEDSLSEGAFNFDFDIDSEDSDGGSMEFESQVADLTDMDEFETKIDLAKAYIDMGDAEAAKVIAEEVVEKGNDDQKKEAQAVLDRL